MQDKSGNMSLFGNGNQAAASDTGVFLYLHDYRYFPYERELARREVGRLVGSSDTLELENCYVTHQSCALEGLRNLTYFAEIATPDKRFPTIQHELEASHRLASKSGKRQATR